jgi:hypothetical protein
MSRREARDAARRKLGNVTTIREEIYQMNTMMWLDGAWRDLRHGARLLRLNPGFAVIAILSLALGVGANTAIFQLLDAVRLRALPVKDPAGLVELRIADPAAGSAPGSSPDAGRASPTRSGSASRSAGGLQRRVRVERADLRSDDRRRGPLRAGSLGQRRLLQRPRRAGARRPHADRRRRSPRLRRAAGRARLRLLQREYGGSPSAIGRTITLDGHSFSIVGVTPASFFGVEVGRSFDVAVPLCAEPFSRGARTALDKRTSGFSPRWPAEPAHGRSGARAARRDLAADFPGDAAGYRAEDEKRYLRSRSALSGRHRNLAAAPPVRIAALAAARDHRVVLLISCANLANLMLARPRRASAKSRCVWPSARRAPHRAPSCSPKAADRRRRRGVRALLAQCSAASSSTSSPPRTTACSCADAGLADLRVHGCARRRHLRDLRLVPAIRATGMAPGAAMKAAAADRATRASASACAGAGRGQVALSLVLVVGAMLFVRSLRNLMTLDAGFTQDGSSSSTGSAARRRT